MHKYMYNKICEQFVFILSNNEAKKKRKKERTNRENQSDISMQVFIQRW